MVNHKLKDWIHTISLINKNSFLPSFMQFSRKKKEKPFSYSSHSSLSQSLLKKLISVSEKFLKNWVLGNLRGDLFQEKISCPQVYAPDFHRFLENAQVIWPYQWTAASLRQNHPFKEVYHVVNVSKVGRFVLFYLVVSF